MLAKPIKEDKATARHIFLVDMDSFVHVCITTFFFDPKHTTFSFVG